MRGTLIIGGLAILTVIKWQQIKSFVSDFALNKINFTVQRPSDVKLDIKNGTIDFNFNYSFVNPLPVSGIKIKNLVIE
jgi:hypothetical protein